MSLDLSQINGQRETLKTSKSSDLRLVLGGDQATQTRRQIGIIADRSLEKGLISREVYDDYKKVAAGVTEHEMSVEMLESARQFALKHEEAALRINEKIQAACRAKIASEGDEIFLMKHLNVKNYEFDQKAEWYERRIDEKLAHMKRDKDQYLKLADHKLIKDIGYLKVDDTVRVIFPNEEGFLKLSVPERRKLLKQLEEALPKAEKYAKKCEENEDEALVADYQEKLDSALKKGIIGEQTYNEFLNGFLKIDHDEKEYWNSEFDGQMERYRVLWRNVRGTLQSEALQSMEEMINQAGYTELFTEFGKLKQSESKRLTADYAETLEGYREAGVIGQHTVAQFVVWMNQQSLSGKYEAEDKLPGQMLRYEELWQKTEQLSGKQQDFMRSKIDIWGYTELNQQYLHFQNGEEIPQDTVDDPESDVLSGVGSKEVKNAIVETDEILVTQGKAKRRTFMEVLDKMFNSVSRDKFDATSFEAQLRDRVAKHNPDIKPDRKARGANDEVDFAQIEEDAEILEETGKSEVVEQVGFIQVESDEETGRMRRETQVTMNDEGGMKRLLSEEGRHSYRSDNAGGNDDLSLAIEGDSGKTTELDLQEVHSLRDYLKKQEQAELDEAA